MKIIAWHHRFASSRHCGDVHISLRSFSSTSCYGTIASQGPIGVLISCMVDGDGGGREVGKNVKRQGEMRALRGRYISTILLLGTISTAYLLLAKPASAAAQ